MTEKLMKMDIMKENEEIMDDLLTLRDYMDELKLEMKLKKAFAFLA